MEATTLSLWLAWGAIFPFAQAELPPPDYREALLASVEAEADALLDQRRYDEALALVADFRTRVIDDPRLVYEEGLIHRHRGDLDQALQHLETAVVQDPDLGFAWYDLAEVRLLLGQRPEAQQAFEEAAARTENHPSGWVAPLKLAEMAAQERKEDAWDRWLREAFRRGFSLALVAENATWAAQWRGHAADPELGARLRRLATVYGELAELERLEKTP